MNFINAIFHVILNLKYYLVREKLFSRYITSKDKFDKSIETMKESPGIPSYVDFQIAKVEHDASKVEIKQHLRD